MGICNQSSICMDCFSFVVKTLSMLPHYKPGDILLVNPFIKPVTGDIVLATYKGLSVLREFRETKAGLLLITFASGYKDILIRKKEFPGMKMARVMRKLKDFG